jgi:sialate O-acetylesterase
VPVWGTDTPGQPVTVRFAHQEVATVADAAGRWTATLAPLSAGGPYDLTATGSSSVQCREVLVGEVWLCSGQSNMEFPLQDADGGSDDLAAPQPPTLRLFRVARAATTTPAGTVKATWTPCTPETLRNFSAVAYAFGRNLERELQVPVGLMVAAWGGTDIRAWIPEPTILADQELAPSMPAWLRKVANHPQSLARYENTTLPQWRADHAKAKAAGERLPIKPKPPSGPNDLQERPAGLFNGMIAPLAPYALRGVIWYQGERNTKSEAEAYRRFLATMIADWRTAFQADLSFHIVQLANFCRDPKAEAEAAGQPWPVLPWAILRESQADVAARIPQTSLTVTIDIGNPDNIHPTNKREVGRRLSLQALAMDYGRSVATSGPRFTTVQIIGDRVEIAFHHADGLGTREGGVLRGFQIAGEDGIFHTAEATIAGQSVVLHHPQVATPVAVRYNWASAPDGNLVNATGLPAHPFRWPQR